MSKQQHILFISHDASLSGAPILLQNLLLLLQENKAARITVVIRRGGPLAAQFREHFRVMVLKPAGYRQGGAFKKLRHIMRNRWQLVRLFMVMPSVDVIFSNTIINGPLLKTLSLFKKPVVTYVHELENVIRSYPAETAATLQYSRKLAYPSLRVKEALTTVCRVPAEQLLPLSYYFPVNPAMLADAAARETFAGAFRQRFNVTDNDLLVGGMGVACNRKGTDIFVETCGLVARANPRIKFCWIGNFDSPATEAALQAQVAALGIQNQMIFCGPMPHHYYNLAAFDVFFLSSREDPYPLAVLEAGFMQVPSICFAGAGGIPEFVEADAGWIMPELSAESAAQTILTLLPNKALLQQKGAVALQKSLEWHANGARILRQFYALIST